MARGMNIFINIGAKMLPSLNSSASKIEQRFGQMNRKLRLQAAETKVAYKEMAGALAPIGAMMAAGGLTMGLKGIFGDGNRWGHEVAMMKASGRSVKDVADGIAQAYKTMRDIPTSHLADNLKVLRETTGAFGDFHHAMENLNFNQKLGYMMSNSLGIAPEESSHQLTSLVQALEIRGTAMDPKKYQSDVGELFKAMLFMSAGETPFDAREFKKFSQTGGIPLKSYSQRFMSRILPSMITEQGGGDIVGTQAQAFQSLVLGRVGAANKTMVAEWERLGLVPKKGQGNNLSKTGWTAGTLKGTDMAMRDPYQWASQVLLPTLQKDGVKTDNTQALTIQLSKMFGRQTAFRFAMALTEPLQRKRLDKDERQIGQAMPLNKSYELMLATDPTAAMAKSMASLDNLSTRLGLAFNDKVIAALNLFADAVNGIGAAVQSHPWLGKLMVYAMGFGAVAATMKVFGIALKWVLSPFKALGGMLMWVARTRAGGLIANMLIRLGGLFGKFGRFVGPLLMRGLKLLGPLLMRGLTTLGPLVLRGIAMAFGLLSNPIGWAILAASAIALIWIYRKELWAAWGTLTTWFKTKAWPAIRDTVTSINWKSVGMWIADMLTFGLASKLPGMVADVKKSLQTGVLSGTFVGQALYGGAPPVPGIAGARAAGGPVGAGGTYLVGERGPELFTPGRSGTIIPHSELQRRRASRDGSPVTFNIYGATDPKEVARQVDARLRHHAGGQSALLSD